MVSKAKPMRKSDENPAQFKPLLLEKQYIVDQEKRLKSEFLTK